MSLIPVPITNPNLRLLQTFMLVAENLTGTPSSASWDAPTCRRWRWLWSGDGAAWGRRVQR